MPIGSVSLDKSANYVTQQGIWDNQKLGRLTDRRIEKYRKMGYYGGVGYKGGLIIRDQKREMLKAARKEKFSVKKTFAEFLVVN